MIFPVTTLGTVPYQPTDSEVEIEASKSYLINSDNIVRTQVYSTDDSSVWYKLNKRDDQQPEFLMRIAETNAQIKTYADTSASSNMISLDVFLNEEGEDCLTFAECALSGSSTTTKYYNISEIVFVQENDDANKSMILLSEGGWETRKIFVDHNLGQLYDLITTGTTSTTTSSTSSTTTEEGEAL